MASPQDVAAALRGMGYSNKQAESLAKDPDGEPKRVVHRRFVGVASRAYVPPRVGKTTRAATSGRRIAVGQSPDDYCAARRWSAQRKAAVIDFVRDGLLAIPDLWTRYGITADEFTSWCEAFDRDGLSGLKVTGRKIAP